MDLSSEIEEFRAMINRMVESLQEVSEASKTIPQTEIAELTRKFEMLDGGCEQVSSELNTAMEMLEEIRSRWGR